MQTKSNEFLRRTITVRPKFVMILAISLTLIFGVSYSVQSARTRRLHVEKQEVQEAVRNANEYAQELERRLSFTATDEYVEQEARQRFGYMAEGEMRFVLDKSYYTNN